MNTKNGSLNVQIAGDTICVTTSDEDTATVAAADMDVEQVETLLTMLEEALIGVECGINHVTYTRLNQ